MNKIPYFECDDKAVNDAFRLAIGCVTANVATIKSGILKCEEPCVMAGIGYAKPWTRDAAINVYNAVALLDPVAAKNTLYAVLNETDGEVSIGDQYWDKIIWAIGAYKLYLINRDKEFLKFAYSTILNTLRQLEHDEYDDETGLFRGAAVYGDGISAYPEKYRKMNGKVPVTCVLDWVKAYPDEAVKRGYGLPMETLSTNCVYKKAYDILAFVAKELGENPDEFELKSQKLKNAINERFWNEKTGLYDYLYNECDAQEGFGLAFAVLFGIADEKKAESIAKNAYSTRYGLPCVYPCFKPYDSYKGGGHYGRHCGTIWPQVQGFFAMAMLKSGYKKRFDDEFFALTKNAVRDKQFVEIYHPDTGLPYGGIQEWENEFIEWGAENYQTWCATAYLNMVVEGIVGLSVGQGVRFNPYLPRGINYASLKNLYIGDTRYDIEIKRGSGECVRNEDEEIYKYTIYIK